MVGDLSLGVAPSKVYVPEINLRNALVKLSSLKLEHFFVLTTEAVRFRIGGTGFRVQHLGFLRRLYRPRGFRSLRPSSRAQGRQSDSAMPFGHLGLGFRV